MNRLIFFGGAFAMLLANPVWGNEKDLAEKQVAEQMPVLQGIVSNHIEAASLEIEGTSLVIKKNLQIIEKSHPFNKPNGSMGNYVTKDIVPEADGMQISYGVGPGPYGGSLVFPAWPKMPDEMTIGNEGYRKAAAIVSIPEEEISVVVTYKFGKNISPATMRSMHEQLLKEAGSFRFGRTFFKALVMARLVPIKEGAVFSPPPEANYNTGYVLRKNGGDIRYGQRPDLSISSALATNSPILAENSPPVPPTQHKTPASTLTPQSTSPSEAIVTLRPFERPLNWRWWTGLAATVLIVGFATWKYFHR